MRFGAPASARSLNARFALVAALLSAPPAGAAPMFVPLGEFPDAESAFAVSADGSVIVGGRSTISTTEATFEAFRWTRDGGFQGLGDLPGGHPLNSSAYGISADGSVIVGSAYGASGPEAFRWTSEGGMVGLGDLPGGVFNSNAADVSADSSVIVGSGNFGFTTTEAFRWTSEGGMVGLGDLAGGLTTSAASGVSADGSVIVGQGSSASGTEAFRWTSAEGMAGLGHLGRAGPSFESFASAVSADGSVIVGGSTSPSGLEAFRWTSEGGMVGLGDIGPEGESFSSYATGVSADGSVIVGVGGVGEAEVYIAAFIWDPIHGMRDLRDVLVNDYGLDLMGWTLDEPTGISADGKVIVGNTNRLAWLVVLPEPSTPLLCGVGLAALAAARRLRT